MTDRDKRHERNTIKVAGTRTSYLNALKIAQDNIDLFVKIFLGAVEGEFKFYIKAKFEDDEYIEHLWLIPIAYKEEAFIAIVDNTPNNLKTIQYQDEVSIPIKEIEDWIFIDKDGFIVGNFIAHALNE